MKRRSTGCLGQIWKFRDPDVDCLVRPPRPVSGATPRPAKRHRTTAARGFTLIEILVTISIIALLLGISAFGVIKVQQGAQRNRVKAMFESLHGAQTNYQSANQSRIIHDGGALSSSEYFVFACLQHPDSAEAMKSATNGPDTYVDKDGDGNFEILDPWGTPILYIAINNADGTANNSTDNEPNTKFPVSRDPFFVSAGQDGEFGTDDDITSIEIDS